MSQLELVNLLFKLVSTISTYVYIAMLKIYNTYQWLGPYSCLQWRLKCFFLLSNLRNNLFMLRSAVSYSCSFSGTMRTYSVKENHIGSVDQLQFAVGAFGGKSFKIDFVLFKLLTTYGSLTKIIYSITFNSFAKVKTTQIKIIGKI